MWRKFMSVALVLASVFTMLMATGGQSAQAGQFKRLNVTALPVGGTVAFYAAPVNQGAAMEMDTYEVLTAGGNHRFRIMTNTTGQTLHLTVLGVNGSPIASCTAAPAATCITPALALVGNLLFQVVVSTQNGSPVTAGSLYRFGVTR